MLIRAWLGFNWLSWLRVWGFGLMVYEFLHASIAAVPKQPLEDQLRATLRLQCA